MTIGIPQEAIKFIIKYLPDDPVFYVKMKAALVENKVSLFEPQALEIGRIPIPIGTFLAINKFKPVSLVYALDIGEMSSDLSRVSDKNR